MSNAPGAEGARQSYDSVVIGAGNGGLASASQLAAKGVKTLLLEQHNAPGGFATSFVRGRFEFEAALHEFADIGTPENKGTVRAFLENDLGIHLDWVKVPEAFRMILTDPGEDLDVTIPYGKEAYIEAVCSYVPEARKEVTRYVELWTDVGKALLYLIQSRGNADRKVLTKEHASFLKTCPYTVDQVAKAMRLPKRARDIMHAQWSYLGPPTSRMNFTIYAAMMDVFLRHDAYIPTKRSHEVSTAVATKFRDLGGDVLYNTRAERILVKDGQVTGVVTSQGDEIATRHVVSNASPTLVYNRMMDPAQVPPIALQECNSRRDGVAGYVVYLGLDVTLEALGLNEYSYFIYRNMDTAAMYESLGRPEAPDMQAVCCLNNALPDCSPPGTSIISITTLYQSDAWRAVKPADYVGLKDRIARDLIVDLERATGAPIREHIEEIEVATPATFARYTGSHGGVIYGYEPEPWDSFMPRLMRMEDELHIKGLRFTGGYAFRSHGYSQAYKTGQTVGLLTFRDLSEEGR
jgi:phytoene dehydrogenase-like protein